jgi:hypothetical protein
MSEATMQEVIPPVRCGKYSPGHEVHWIPGIRFSGEERVPASIIFEDYTTILVSTGSSSTRYFNHEVTRLAAAAERFGMEGVSINLKRKMLYVKSSDDSFLVFNLTTEQITTC